jgi:hypothetical protein
MAAQDAIEAMYQNFIVAVSRGVACLISRQLQQLMVSMSAVSLLIYALKKGPTSVVMRPSFSLIACINSRKIADWETSEPMLRSHQLRRQFFLTK